MYNCDCLSPDMTCVSECPAGTYAARQLADGSELGYCLPCDRACSSCSGASRQDCVTCSAGHLRLLRLCVTHCPTGYASCPQSVSFALLTQTSLMNFEVEHTPMCGNVSVCLVSRKSLANYCWLNVTINHGFTSTVHTFQVVFVLRTPENTSYV